MLRSQLNSYSGGDPIWGFVALIGAEHFTGEAVVGTEQRVHLYALAGRIYYAEHDGDLPIGTRLVSCGAITATQLEYGAVDIAGVQSLARLFQRQPHIDRDAVELTIENATERLLESVATAAVGTPEVFPLRHHPAGIHHWLRSVAATVAPPASEPALQAAPPPPAVENEFAEPEAPAIEEPSVATTFEPEAAAPMPEVPVLEVPVLETPVLEVPVLEVPVLDTPTGEPEPTWEPEPLTLEPEPLTLEPEPLTLEPETAYEPEPAAPLLAPLSLQPLSPLVAQQPPAPEPEPEPVEPEPLAVEPVLAVAEPEQPTADPLMARLAPLPPTSAISAADAASIFLPAGADLPDLPEVDDLPELSSVAYLPSVGGDLTTGSAALSERPPTLAAGPTDAASYFTAPAAQPMAPDPAMAGALPKLATAPFDVDAMMAGLPMDAARPTAGQPHNLAAVEIWELVDHMLDEPGSESAPPISPANADDKRAGKGRLRGRKG